MSFGINPQILSNALDRGLNRNMQRQQMAAQKDERLYQRARQNTADKMAADQYQRQLGEYERQKKNRDIQLMANQADYFLGTLEQGGQLTPQQNNQLNQYMSELGTVTANMRAGDARPRKFVGFKPVGGGRYAADLEVTNDDGSKYMAPVTENGTSDPNDQVKTYSLSDIRSNLRQLSDLARIQAGDNSPIERRNAAALEAQKAKAAEAKWQRDNKWERDKLRLAHGYGLGEIAAKNKGSMDLERLKQKGLAARDKAKGGGGAGEKSAKLSGIDGTLLKALSVPAVDDKGEPVIDWNTGLQVVTRDPARENRFFKFMRDNGLTDGKQALVDFLDYERGQQAVKKDSYTMKPNQGPQPVRDIMRGNRNRMEAAVKSAQKRINEINASDQYTTEEKQKAAKQINDMLIGMGVDFNVLNGAP